MLVFEVAALALRPPPYPQQSASLQGELALTDQFERHGHPRVKLEDAIESPPTTSISSVATCQEKLPVRLRC